MFDSVGGDAEKYILSLINAPLHNTVATTAVVVTFSFVIGIAIIQQRIKEIETEAPYESGTFTYNPEIASKFFADRPLLVVTRILKLASLTAIFNTGLLFDWIVLGKLLGDENYTALKRAEPR